MFLFLLDAGNGRPVFSICGGDLAGLGVFEDSCAHHASRLLVEVRRCAASCGEVATIDRLELLVGFDADSQIGVRLGHRTATQHPGPPLLGGGWLVRAAAWCLSLMVCRVVVDGLGARAGQIHLAINSATDTGLTQLQAELRMTGLRLLVAGLQVVWGLTDESSLSRRIVLVPHVLGLHGKLEKGTSRAVVYFFDFALLADDSHLTRDVLLKTDIIRIDPVRVLVRTCCFISYRDSLVHFATHIMLDARFLMLWVFKRKAGPASGNGFMTFD